MLLHLSQLINLVIPMGGYVAPILMWALNKDKNQEVDIQGKIVLNWLISEFIYLIVGGILVLLIIGIPVLIALLIVGVVFPIIAAVKANNGERWKYPLSIQFFSVP